MAASEVVIGTTPVDDKTIVECSVCGPVGVSNLPIHEAALAHLSGIHNITQMKRAEN